METKSPLDRLLELDARHDDLLKELTDLDEKISTVLSQYTLAKASLNAEDDDNSDAEATVRYSSSEDMASTADAG